MKAAILGKGLKKSKNSVDLKKEVWDVPLNKDLLAQAVYVYRSNLRQGSASTKDRSQVRGGGRKPWRQKGTGRARAGSIRSPLWVGGGVTFGPGGENWSRGMNKKMKRLATKVALSDALREESLHVLDTRKVSRSDFDAVTQTKLFVVVGDEDYKKFRNLSRVDVIQADDLNAFEVINHAHIYVSKDAVEHLNTKLG